MSYTSIWSMAQTISSNNLEIKDYINFILEYKYDEAKKIDFKNDLINKQAFEIVQLHYYAGQKGKLSSTPSSKKPLSIFFSLYFKGYNLLYSSPNSIDCFDYFIRAYEKGKEIGNNDLQKLALLGVQDVFNFQIKKTNEDRSYYLNKYSELCQNKVDSFHLKMNSLIFNLKENVTYLNKSYINSFDSFMNNFPEEHDFQVFYSSTIAPLLTYLDEEQKAQNYYQKVISSEKFDFAPYKKRLFFRSYVKKSEFFAKKKQYDSALIAISKANEKINLADTLRAFHYINKNKSELFANLELYDSAYYYLLNSNDLESKLDILNNNIAISESNVKYQTAEKEKKIIKITAIAIILAGFLSLGSIIAFLIYRSTKRKQRIAEQEKELEIQKTTQVLKEKEVETINAMVEGQEKERLRLAGELHDNLGSTLATVKMQVENLERNLEKVDDPKGLLSKTNTLINEAYQKVRRISHDRNSGVMAKEGLLPAVQKLAKQISSSGPLQIDIQDFGLENRLSNHLEITIFRIIQELTTNIVKHAQASEASISLTQHDNELNIIVEDNGKGFKVGKLEQKDGMGLGSIERRVEHLEGSMEVDSTLGKGTIIIIDIPLETSNDNPQVPNEI